ncbi:MAG: trypsin-like serine protease [Smithella sp.]
MSEEYHGYQKEEAKVFEKTIADVCMKTTCIITCDPSTAGFSVFSGVFFKDNAHYYVVTAHHCLEGIRRFETLSLSNYGAQTMNKPLKYVKKKTVEDRTIKTDIDIEIIELAADYAESLNAEWITRDKIADQVQVGDPVFVVGFPCGLIRRDKMNRRVIYPNPFASFSEIVTAPDSESFLHPIDPNIDVFTGYSEKSMTIDDVEIEVHPEGMSGGGVFAFAKISADRGELWSPEIKLVAIQSAFFKKESLRAKFARIILPTIDSMQ